jgi:hypothetical protein
MQLKTLEEPPQLGRKACMPSIMVTDDHIPLLWHWLIISISILRVRVLRIWVVIWITSLFLLFSWLLFWLII